MNLSALVKKPATVLPWIILTIILLFILSWRFKVGMVRFFDADEFTHMHWAADIAKGQRPYLDFFTFFTPGYHWLLVPLFYLFPHDPYVFIAGRILEFGIFLGILIVTGILFSLTRSKKYALLPVVLLAFLPMPFDKFLEIRPDNLSTLCALIGVVGEIIALRHENKSLRKKAWIVSGMAYAASVIALMKMLPFSVVGLGIAVVSAGWGMGEGGKFRLPKKIPEESFLLLGMGIVGFLFGIWALTLGNIPVVLYSLLKLPFEANQVLKFYIMESHLFFFPNGSFYGAPGFTIGFLLNHSIWLLGIFVACYRMFTPFLTGEGDRKRALVELLLSGIFLIEVYWYVQFFPMKHSQYLIPIAVFIAYYAADGMVMLFNRIKNWHWIFPSIVLIVIAFVLARGTEQVNYIKQFWTNEAQLKELSQLMQIVPAKDEVFDLEGRMIYWNDGYFICCLAYGDFLKFFTHQPPPLREELERKKVAYFFQGDTGRLGLLPWEDQQYIKANYQPVAGWGEKLWKRK